MNQHEPMRRFLGLDPSADPIDVLGLDPARLDMKSILMAREAREQQIQDHPDGNSEDAQKVKAHVRDAAVLLLDANARLPVIARHIPVGVRDQMKPDALTVSSITDFDRQVLGVLMACGGWNSQSRAQLMLIASQHEVPPGQLMDVLMGMTSWLRSGGAASQMPGQGVAEPGSTIQRALASTAPAPTTEAFDRFVDRWTPDIRASDSASVARLSILFASTAILLFVLILGFMLAMPSAKVDQPAEMATHETQASLSSDISAPTVDSVGDLLMEDVAGGGQVLVQKRDLPRSLHDAADAVVSTAVSFDLLTEGIARGEDTSITVASFAELMEVAGRGWILTGPAQREELIHAIQRLFAMVADDNTLANTILNVLTVAPPVITEIDSIPLNAFRAGVLGVLADDRQLSPSLREEARNLLVSSGIQGLNAPGFAPAALAWLIQSEVSLLESTEINQECELEWLAWMRSVLAVDDLPRSQATLALAVQDLIHRGLSISQPGPTRDSLIRLLSILDYTNSEVVRDTIINLYADPELSSQRLWVLTNLLAQLSITSWFDKSMVVSSNADSDQRLALQAQLKSRWPDPIRVTYSRKLTVPEGFNAGVAGHWLDQWDVLQEQVVPRSEIGMLQSLLQMRLMNQAAASLADGAASEAIGLLRDLETGEALDDSTPSPPAARHATNSWGYRMSKAKTRDDKIRILDELKRFNAGDLTPHDASVLAYVVFSESSRIREHGQRLVTQRLQNDPELILAILNRLPANPSKSVSDFMEVIVGHSLPHVQSPRWSWETNRILANRALVVRSPRAQEIDKLVKAYTQSVLDEAQRLLEQEFKDDMLPVNALDLLADARADRVRSVMSASDLLILSESIKQHEGRYRLAKDSLQRAFVGSLGVFHLLILEWSIKIPSHASEFEMIEEDSLQALPVAGHVLDQLILVEQAIGETWRIVLRTYRQEVRNQKESMG